MIGYIRGEVLECSEGRLLVGVGPSGGSLVGYQLTVKASDSTAFQVGKTVSLHVYSHIREDAFDLYGFLAAIEKDLFLLLLSVSGIGPKSAMAALSGAGWEQMVNALSEGDAARLTQVPGVGKKTAERLVAELRDKVRKKLQSGDWRARMQPVSQLDFTLKSPEALSSALVRDATDALVGLGYKESVASVLLNKARQSTERPFEKVEDLIKSALRHSL